MRKHTKRKHYALNGPMLPLTDTHTTDLSLQAHIAATRLDTVQGLNSFCDILTKVTVAMEVDKKHDKQSRALLSTAVKKIESSMDSGKLQDKDEAYLKLVACNLSDWLASGRITYRGYLQAKKVCKRLDAQVLEAHANR